jgi:hypothetical protein
MLLTITDKTDINGIISIEVIKDLLIRLRNQNKGVLTVGIRFMPTTIFSRKIQMAQM